MDESEHRELSTQQSSSPVDEPRSSIWTQSLQANDYKQMVLEKKKRRRRKKRTCGNLSVHSWVMLVLAVLQVVIVAALQIAIVTLGQFRQEKLQNYVPCLDDEKERILQCAEINNITISFPSFGKDKEVYVYLFLALTLYDFFLLLYALLFQNIVEIFAFVVINILAMMYACLQVYQFRGFGSDCNDITPIGYIALTNVLVLFMFSSVYIVLALFIYIEFGWKIYKLVNCDAAMRYYYRMYQIFMSGVKLVILFTVIFNVIQDIFILPSSNYEFPLAILICVVAIASYFFIVVVIRKEWLLGYIIIFLVGVALAAQYIWKMYRFISKNCPVCIERVNLINSEIANVTRAVRELCTLKFSDKQEMDLNETINDIGFDDRSQEFLSLVLLACVNLIIVLLVLAFFIHFWQQRKRGLRTNYFDKVPLLPCLSKPTKSEGGGVEEEGVKARGHTFTFFNKSNTKRSAVAERSAFASHRDSSLDADFDKSPSEPDWGSIPPPPVPGPQGTQRGVFFKNRGPRMASIVEEKENN